MRSGRANGVSRPKPTDCSSFACHGLKSLSARSKLLREAVVAAVPFVLAHVAFVGSRPAALLDTGRGGLSTHRGF